VKHAAHAAGRKARQNDGRAGKSVGQADDLVGADGTGQPQSAGGGPGDPARSARRLAQLPYLVVLVALGLGLLLMRGSGGQAVRGGTLVIAGALLAGSVIRLALPEGRAGMLGSRRRLADAAVLIVLGAGLLIAGLIVRVPG
jgi:hypothetical protein